MANTDYQGFGDETLSNALAIKDSIKDIASSTQQLNRYLRVTGNDIAGMSSTYTDIAKSADKVASIQEKAAKNSKGMTAALEEQAKQTTIIRKLNIQIEDLHEKAANASTPAITAQLKRQAENLANARDNAQELANSYGTIANDSAKLNKSTSFFSQLSAVASSIPVLNKFSAPFEKAAEAARKVTIENAKIKQKKDQISKLSASELATGRGLTQAKLRSLGLDGIAQGRNMQERAASLRNYQSSAKAQSASGQAMKTAGAEALGMSNLLGKGGLIGLLLEIGKFIIELFVSAQERTVEIAKDLSITRDAAEGIRQQYIAIAAQSANLLVNTKSLVEAQQAFSEYSQAVSWTSADTLTNQVFLTKNLGIAADKAADFNYLMEATGQDIEGSTDKVGNMSKSFAKINGFTVPTAKILKSIANTSKEIQGYFGFSVQKLAAGVLTMSKFGLELNDALSISKSLLDFESSLGNELELELLTGKEFNLERARALAITGDIAGATDQVLSQMQNLTEEQRKSPLIMESMAKTAGISADQLNRAYLVNMKLNTSAREYYNELVAQGRVKEANNLIDQLGEQATKAEMEKTLTAQDAFNAALEKAKDQFSGLVSSGALDMLVDVIVDFAKTMKDWGFGKKSGENRINETAAAAQSTMGTNATDMQKGTLERLRAQAGGTRSNKYEGDIIRAAKARAEELNIEYGVAKEQLEAEAAKKLQEIESGKRTINAKTGKTELKVDDYIIKPLEKDTITMAGGTKLGGNTEAILTEMLAEWRKGMNLYVGGQKINEIVGLNMYQIGNK